LRNGVIQITADLAFGAASASPDCNKEAAHSSNMTFTHFASACHFPNRSGWQNGILHRLS
jgi:hypothetical protein